MLEIDINVSININYCLMVVVARALYISASFAMFDIHPSWENYSGEKIDPV